MTRVPPSPTDAAEQNLKADPESGSTLDNRITTLLGADGTNSTSLTQRASKQAFGGIVDEVRTLHAEPADWFFGVAVSSTDLWTHTL